MAWQLKVYGVLIEKPKFPDTHGKSKFTIYNILAQKPIPKNQECVDVTSTQ